MNSFIPKVSFLMDLIKRIAPNKDQRVCYMPPEGYRNVSTVPFKLYAPVIYERVTEHIKPGQIVEVHFGYDCEKDLFSVEFEFTACCDSAVSRFPNANDDGLDPNTMTQILSWYYENHFIPRFETDHYIEDPWDWVEYEPVSEIEACTKKDKVITPQGVRNLLEVTSVLNHGISVRYNCDVTEVLRELKFQVEGSVSHFRISADLNNTLFVDCDTDEDFSLNYTEAKHLLQHCYMQEVNPHMM